MSGQIISRPNDCAVVYADAGTPHFYEDVLEFSKLGRRNAFIRDAYPDEFPSGTQRPWLTIFKLWDGGHCRLAFWSGPQNWYDAKSDQEVFAIVDICRRAGGVCQ